MRISRRFLAFVLAISFVFSMFSFNVSAGDGPIESPIIPIPSTPQIFVYECDAEAKTAVITSFNKTSGKTQVTVPSTYVKDGVEYAVVGIGKDAFKEATVQSVVIEAGVRFIEEGAFANCAALTSVSMAESVTSVDSTAFDGSLWLENQPDGVVYVGKVALKVKGSCGTSVVLKNNTVAIADGAFKGQSSLEKIFVPPFTTIGTDSFAGCTAVTVYCYENSPADIYAKANGINTFYVPALVLKSAPIKLKYYQNDPLKLNGIELVYLTENGETSIEVTPEMVTGYDASVLGAQTLTVTYDEYTVNFSVTVSERPLYIPGDLDENGELGLNDVVCMLYHVNFPEIYPVTQDANFDGVGGVDINDAIHLLYHLNFGDDYPLN